MTTTQRHECSTCDCAVRCSRQVAEEAHEWSWETGAPVCFMCREADVGADDHECEQESEP